MDHLQQLIERYPVLAVVKKDISNAFELIKESYIKGGKLLIAGNGGSASDAEHIAGELMKTFAKKRALPDSFVSEIKKIDNDISEYLLPKMQPGLPAIALSGHASLNTACINDIDGNITFAQQVYGYGKEVDILLGISTSGNSKNILYACAVAKAKKLKIIGLTGISGGKIKQFTDVCICVPETETYKIQELHLPVYHILCMMLEDYFF
ncbi:MAG: SIS domain-containing protein [Treponema sp.]|nr:SIS domain-containing protein [Treponema sp.]MCL2250390.1 SIS domain-containing protein [Treponema sp.]